ncbi:VWA domain-containing protein [Azohydromonas sediminis]|uniref:VWA domain-containing protein n=1 Tax=Azohydromonas sediminis TaxID=2259674 RepID=UPI000E65366D|nr:VWA domain-containing protein [Azohydromonas sediminis]
MSARDAPYDRLAALARGLWLPAVVTSAGTAAARLDALPRWRDALEAGALPDAGDDFGDPALVGALRAAVGELDLPALARGVPAMAEQVLRTVLWHADRVIDRAPGEPRADAIARAVQAFRAEWQVERGDWEQMLALLQGLGDLRALRWDELQGLWRAREWREAQRLAAVLERLPALADVIRRLGRRDVAAGAPQPTPAPARAAPPRALAAVETRIPDAPGEITGIRRSAHVERQLASEAMLMHHPAGRKLWRARRAEARLLAWDSEAVLADWRADPQAKARAAAAPTAAPPLARGPFIVCLDSSGSMAGAPEQIAKAVVLQALRTAHAERRGCKLIAFGGAGELVERDLDAGAAGLAALFELLGQGFDGGTDVAGPIEHAIEAVHDGAGRWRGADLLIVSDGEFGCTRATLERLDAARAELGLHVQGILVGDRETMGLMEVCDDIHWVRDWRRFGSGGDAGGFSPVHSKSLTALFFPNALSARAARHRPG